MGSGCATVSKIQNWCVQCRINHSSVVATVHTDSTAIIKRLLVIMDTIETDDVFSCVRVVPGLVPTPSPPDANRNITVASNPTTANVSIHKNCSALAKHHGQSDDICGMVNAAHECVNQGVISVDQIRYDMFETSFL